MPLETGDLHWADLDGYRGTEQGGRRPVLIVSENFYNSRKQSCDCLSDLFAGEGVANGGKAI